MNPLVGKSIHGASDPLLRNRSAAQADTAEVGRSPKSEATRVGHDFSEPRLMGPDAPKSCPTKSDTSLICVATSHISHRRRLALLRVVAQIRESEVRAIGMGDHATPILTNSQSLKRKLVLIYVKTNSLALIFCPNSLKCKKKSDERTLSPARIMP